MSKLILWPDYFMMWKANFVLYDAKVIDGKPM